ncbi:hypothetical protein ACFXNW_19470 [Nocardia sp. NPDC059180]|uniref:hypothetical protein n=1 Tax=Nocardia sp. NPDC059180 TaxID=3346761 RepID=UPI003688DF4B
MITLLLGLIASGAMLTAGPAAAETNRADSSHKRSDSGSNHNKTGWRKIDPRGYHHSETDPRRRADQRDARREYRQQQRQPEVPRSSDTGGGTSTWTRSDRADGSGWTVCKPQASYC